MARGWTRGRPFSRVRGLACLCAVLTLAPAAAAQDDEVRLSSEVVLVPLALRATDGAALKDLTAADFVVSDGGVAPEVAFFERDVAPLDVVLLVDTSASTGATLDVLERSAAEFVNHLRREDSYTLLTFAEKPNVLVGWTSDPRAVKNTLTFTTPAGYTLLNMSAIIALKAMFEGRAPARRRALVILTDGIDTGSGFYTTKKVGDEALARDVTVYVVSVDRLASDAIDVMIKDRLVPESTWGEYREMQDTLREVEPALVALADATGGRVLFPTKTGDLSAVYEQVADELRSRYVIGFYVPDGAAAGYHPISVTAKRKGLSVRARAGYFHEAGAEAKP